MVLPRFKNFWFCKYNPTGHNERKTNKKKRWKGNIKEWTGMDFASSKQYKMERDCREFICGAPTTFQGYGENRIEIEQLLLDETFWTTCLPTALEVN